MQPHLIMNNNTLRRGFYFFLLLHLLIWTLLPYFFQKNAPFGTLEALAWGQQWQWGYDRDPYLIAWLAQLIGSILRPSLWPLYLTSQIAIVGCFWAIWRLALDLRFSISQAFIAVLVLEGIFFYHYMTPELNDNVLIVPLWAFTVLACYKAITKQHILDWLLLGVWAGLAMMAKYSTAVLLLCLFLFMLGTKTGRDCFRKPGLYIALFVFAVIVTPNLIWLAKNHFIYLNYTLDRASPEPLNWKSHITHPVIFMISQILVVLPALLLFCFLSPIGSRHVSHLTSFDKRFLIWVGLGPTLIIFFLSAITSLDIRTGWTSPLFSWVGLLLLMWFNPVVTKHNLRRLFKATAVMLGLFSIGYILDTGFGPYFAHYGRQAQFPGQEIAARITTQWQMTYHRPLSYVAGSRWLAGNISYYAIEHPTAYFDWDLKVSPWIKEEKLRQAGGVFIWEVDKDKQPQLPDDLAKRFPNILLQPVAIFAWNTYTNVPPVRLGVAFLPPAK